MPPIDDDDDDRPRSRGRDEADDDEDRPRRRRRDDDDFDSERRKKKSGGGGLVIAIVIGGIIAVLGCGGILLFALLLPAITKVREAASRAQEMNNLKQIALSMHNHASIKRDLPRADDDLSWRVHILPYIEQESLYRQFDLNQPWNQGRNQQLADTFILTYQSKLDEPPTAQTHYRAFVGPGTAFDTTLWKRGPFPSYITDGTSNTILTIDTAETVPWPQPKEIPFQPNGSLPEFGNAKRSQVLVALADGSVRAFDKKKVDQATIRALATANGNEAIGDW